MTICNFPTVKTSKFSQLPMIASIIQFFSHLCNNFWILLSITPNTPLSSEVLACNWFMYLPQKIPYTFEKQEAYNALWKRCHGSLQYAFVEFWMIFSDCNSNMKQTFLECHSFIRLSRNQYAPMQFSHSLNLRILLTTNDCLYYTITFSFVVIIWGYYF